MVEEIGGKAKVGGGGVEAGSEDQEAGPGSRGGAGGKRGREEDEGAVVARSLKGDWEEGGDERDGDHGAKRRSDAGDGCSKKAKNIPAHRGAFKRHLRKHTFLFQREGGKIPKGFIVTCVQEQGQEARAINSCSKLLRMALAQLMGPSPPQKQPEASSSAATATEAASKEDRGEGGGGGAAKEELLWVIDPGCNGVCCFTLEMDNAPDPIRLLKALWEIAERDGTGRMADAFAKEHFACHRFLPMQVACRSVLGEIIEACKPLLEPVFGTADKPTKEVIRFSVVCDIRSCHSIKRTDVINGVAGLVDTRHHKVSLSDPETVILVQVIRAACGIAVVREAQAYKTSRDTSFHMLSHAAAARVTKQQQEQQQQQQQ